MDIDLPQRFLRGRRLLNTCDANLMCSDTITPFTCFTCTILGVDASCPTDPADQGCTSDCSTMALLNPSRLITHTVVHNALDSSW